MKNTDLKKNVFETPAGYFDKLPGRVRERIESEKTTHHNHTASMSSWTYAVAASLALLLAASIFIILLQENKTVSDPQIEQLLAEVPDEAMLEYIQSDTDLSVYEIDLTEEEQEQILLQKLEDYDLPTEAYEYEIYELEDYY